MILLRLLAFEPVNISTAIPTAPQQQSAPIKKAAVKTTASTNNWDILLADLSLTGMAQSLAINCAFKRFENDTMELTLHPSHAALLNDKLKTRLTQALNDHFQKPFISSLPSLSPTSKHPLAYNNAKPMNDINPPLPKFNKIRLYRHWSIN